MKAAILVTATDLVSDLLPLDGESNPGLLAHLGLLLKQNIRVPKSFHLQSSVGASSP